MKTEAKIQRELDILREELDNDDLEDEWRELEAQIEALEWVLS